MMKRTELVNGVIAARVNEGKRRASMPTDAVVDVIRDAIEGKSEQPAPVGHASADSRQWGTFAEMIAANRWGAIAEALGRTLETAGAKWKKDHRSSMPQAVTAEQIAEATKRDLADVVDALEHHGDDDLIVEKQGKRLAVTLSNRQNAAAAGFVTTPRAVERKKLADRLAALDAEEDADELVRERARRVIAQGEER